MADFKLFNTTPAAGNIKLGSTSVSQIYFNTTLVWPIAVDNGTTPIVPGISPTDEVCLELAKWGDKAYSGTTYANGDPIPYVGSAIAWAALTTGAWCYMNNDPLKSKLYNRYAIADPRGVAPIGWRIPTSSDVLSLFTCLTANNYGPYQGKIIAAKNLSGQVPWAYSANLNSPGNIPSTNGITNFNLAPNGYRSTATSFGYETTGALFWIDDTGFDSYIVVNYSPDVYIFVGAADAGFNIRLRLDVA